MTIVRNGAIRFNPKKSAVLVYGETANESAVNSKYRMYRLGKDRIKEETSYDHLGLKNNSLGKGYERTAEKISKGRKALNAASGLGLKPGGLTIKACSLLFWSMVIPITTYACELWVMSDEGIKLIEDIFRAKNSKIPSKFPKRNELCRAWMDKNRNFCVY